MCGRYTGYESSAGFPRQLIDSAQGLYLCLAVYLPEAVVLVAELNTGNRQALSPGSGPDSAHTGRPDVIGREGERLFREGQFLPRTLQDLAGFLMEGVSEGNKEDWLLGVALTEVLPNDVLLNLAPAYSIGICKGITPFNEGIQMAWRTVSLRISPDCLDGLLASIQ